MTKKRRILDQAFYTSSFKHSNKLLQAILLLASLFLEIAAMAE